MHFTVKYKSYIYFCTIGSLILTAAAFRMIGINNGLWHDEAATMVLFVDQGFSTIVAGDVYRPNNQIFYSIVIWLLTNIFGFSEFIVRIPSIIASIAAMVIFYRIAYIYSGKLISLIFLIGMVFSDYHVFITSEARGYGFVVLCVALLTHYGLKLIEDFKKKELIYFSLVGVLGVYTFPSLIVVVGLTYLVLLLKLRRTSIFVSGSTSLLTISLLYSPLFAKIKYYYVNFGGGFTKHERPEWYNYFTFPVDKVFDTFGFNISATNVVDVNQIVHIFISLVLIFGLIQAYKYNRDIVYLGVVPPLGFLVLAIIFSVPIASTSRYTMFIDFIFIYMFSIGLGTLISKTYLHLSKRGVVTNLHMLICLVLLISPIVLSSLQSTHYILKQKPIPRESYKDAFRYVESLKLEDFKLIVLTARTPGFEFYAKQYEDILITESDEEALEEINGYEGTTVLIDYTLKKGPTKIKVDAEPVTFKQRRGGHINLYVLD